MHYICSQIQTYRFHLDRHCTVALNTSTLFVFGGVSGINPNHTYSEYEVERKVSPMTPNLNGFFLEFPDPSDPGFYVHREVYH